jgi:hypothetical protein
MDIVALRRIVEGMMSSLAVPTFRWATVTQTTPLRIKYPTEEAPLPFAPTVLGPAPSVGADVLTVRWGTRIAVLGQSGGTPYDTLPLSALFVNGTPAQTPTAIRDGGWVSLEGAWQMAAGTSPVTPEIAYNTTTTLFTLPAGWRPTKLLTFPSGAFGATAQMTADVRVATDGTVSVHVNNAGSGPTGGHFSLNAVRYRL